jgi:hypothetical protein
MLTGRIVQPRDFIQIVVVQLIVERCKGALDVREIHNPPGMGIDLARDGQAHIERVPMKTRTLVALGDVG